MSLGTHLIVLVLSLAPPAAGPTDPLQEAAVGAASGLAERIQAVIARYDAGQASFSKAYREAADDAERQRVFEELYPQADDFCGELLALAGEDPRAEASGDALAWVLMNTQDAERFETALAWFRAHHLAHAQITRVLGVFESRPSDGSAFLTEVAERTADGEVAARARYALAMNALFRANLAARLQGEPEAERAGYANYYGEARVAELLQLDPAPLRERAELLLVELEQTAAEVVHGRRGTLGELCARELFELRHLQIGMLAPDIEGADLDGVSFRLSDYRGKVVVLDFWGNW